MTINVNQKIHGVLITERFNKCTNKKNADFDGDKTRFCRAPNATFSWCFTNRLFVNALNFSAGEIIGTVTFSARAPVTSDLTFIQKVQMDDFVHGQVVNLYERLLDKTLMKIVRQIARSSPLVPTLDTIQEKLDANAYITPFDFALDVRSMFISAKRGAEQNRVRILAVEDLSNWFERHLHNLSMTPQEELHRRLEKVQRKFSAVRRAMSLSAKVPGTLDVAASGETKGLKHPPVTLLNEIQMMLAEATTPEIQVRLTSVLKRHIPNFVPAETVTLQASDISLKCAEELKEVLEKAKQEKAGVVNL